MISPLMSSEDQKLNHHRFNHEFTKCMYQSQNELYTRLCWLRKKPRCRDLLGKGEILEGDFTKFNTSEKNNPIKISFAIS